MKTVAGQQLLKDKIAVTLPIKMTPDEVKDFVNKASQCDFDIDIFYNHFIIDAKSILGVMGLDFNSTLTVKYAGDNHEFESYVNTLCVA